MVGDSAYDMMDWHDYPLATGVCRLLRTPHKTPIIRLRANTESWIISRTMMKAFGSSDQA